MDGGQNIVIQGHAVAECDLGIVIGAENPGRVTRGITVNTWTGNTFWGASGDATEWTWGALSGTGFKAWQAAAGA